MLAAVVARRRSLPGVVGALAVTVLAVSGCAAGQDAQTVEQTSVVDGTAFEAGNVNLRDVGLAPPTASSYAQGSNAFLEGLVVNKDASEDRLVSVSSPAASSVVIYNNQADALLGVATDTASPSASASSSDTATASPTNTGSPTQPGTSTPTGGASESGVGGATATTAPSTSSSSASPTASGAEALTEVPLPTNQSVQFGYQSSQLAIVFVGLTKQLFPAQTFPITFTFANGGSVTAVVAVKLPTDGALTDAPTVNVEEEQGGVTPSESSSPQSSSDSSDQSSEGSSPSDSSS